MTTCKTNFTEADNDLAYKLNQSLSTAGVTCEEMDQGTNIINYDGKSCPSKSMKSCMVGAHDEKLEASEVFEFAFDRYEKYQKIIEGVTGRKLPWVLDDDDSTTTFDADVRKKVQGAIDNLKAILKSNGVKEGTEEYKEKMAVGLFYLAAEPGLDVIDKDMAAFVERTSELDKIGLGDFKYYLIDNGGGIRGETDYSEEFTALESLKQKRGKCTEKSKILFALYKIAGLKPIFIEVKRSAIKITNTNLQAAVNEIPQGMDHMCIGLSIGGRIRLFDTSLQDSHATHNFFSPFTPRQSFSYFLANSGATSGEKGTSVQRISYYNEALKINSRNVAAYTNRGNEWAAIGELDKSIVDYGRALSIDPKNARILYNRGVSWADKGNLDKAISDFTDALNIDPNLIKADNLFVFVFIVKGQLSRLIEIYAKLLKVEPLALNDGKIFSSLRAVFQSWREKNPAAKKVSDNFSQETGGLDVSIIETYLLLSYSMWLATGQSSKPAYALEKINKDLIFKEKPSQSTKDFFAEMFSLMPPDMAKNKQIIPLVESIKAKLK